MPEENGEEKKAGREKKKARPLSRLRREVVEDMETKKAGREKKALRR